MGLLNFPTGPFEGGLLPFLVINTVLSFSILKKLMISAMVQITGAVVSAWEANDGTSMYGIGRKKPGISIIQFGTLRKKRGRGDGGGTDGGCAMECCVCLCCFEAEDEVSELPCMHYFHKGCVEKWFDGGDRRSTTCPLCRSVA
ncbi:hypothetical protein Droror1_Dr00018649 [Drosera rotundifolia]